MAFEPLAGLFALVFAVVAAALPLRTWRARLIHAAFTGAVVLTVAFVARTLAERSLEDRFSGADRAAAEVLERYAGGEVSAAFVTDAAEALSAGGPRIAAARRTIEALCRRDDCNAPTAATAYAIKGVLETVANDAARGR